MVSESYKDSKLFYADRSKHLASSNFYETAEHTDESGEEWEDTSTWQVSTSMMQRSTPEEDEKLKTTKKKG